MRKLITYTLYSSVFLTYCFFTLPLLLPTNTENEIARFDAIVVLGGGVTIDCHLDRSLESRMDVALGLFKQKKAPKIIVTGGPQERTVSCTEAGAMRQYALYKNIADDHIIIESLALNTYQNAYNTIEIMKSRGLKSAIIVTTDFHIKRANVIFKEYDIEYRMAAAANSNSGIVRYQQLVKEQVLLCFHAIFGVPDGFGLKLKEKTLAAVLKSLASI